MEAYEKEKKEAIERAAENGSLEIVETENGDLIAVDKDGVFYSTANSTDFTQNKPDKAGIDRLVKDIQKADDARMKKRKDRAAKEEDGDVTYINQKNKVCQDGGMCSSITNSILAIQHETVASLRRLHKGNSGQLRAWYRNLIITTLLPQSRNSGRLLFLQGIWHIKTIIAYPCAKQLCLVPRSPGPPPLLSYQYQ